MLDIQTLMWLTSVAGGTVALWLLTTVPATQRQRDHAPWFIRGTLLLSLGFFLLSWRGQWPDWATIAIANLAVVGAIHSYHLGMRALGNRGGPGSVDAIAAGVFALFFLASWLGGAGLTARTVLVSSATFGWLAATVWQARGNPELMSLKSGRAAVVWLVVLALVLVTRAVVVVLIPIDAQTLLTRNVLGVVPFTAAFMMTLVTSIGYLGIARERSEVELERRASFDPLTNLPNRRTLFDYGIRQVALARRHSRPLALLVIDLDHFKSINDRYGHMTGDLALQCFATAGAGELRASDLLARAGGEEFCAILPETDLNGARIVAERIRAALKSRHVGDFHPPLTMTCSIGVAVLHAGELTIDEVFNRADTAMYAAKAAGRDRVFWASPVESIAKATA